MILRARHLLCVVGNLTQWYSPESLRVIKDIEQSYKQDLHQIIQLGKNCDKICSNCPHCILNLCQKRYKSSKEYEDIDMYILKQCYIDEKISYRFIELIQRMYYSLKKEDIKHICQYCQFTSICKTYLTLTNKERK